MSTTSERTIADRVPVTAIMSRHPVSARDDLSVHEVAQMMLRNHFGSIPIVDERGRPRGMVTKTDLLELVVKPQLDVGSIPVSAVMMPLAIVLDEHATVAHCATMMASEDFHHVPIVSCTGALVGLVSSQDIVRWLVANDALPVQPS